MSGPPAAPAASALAGKRVLVTGIGGFIGRYVARTLLEASAQVFGLVRPGHEPQALRTAFDDRVRRIEVDLLDGRGLEMVLRRHTPDAIAHLAGFSSAGRSYHEPERCFEVNALGTERLLAAIARTGARPRVLIVSSAEVYGGGSAPLTESDPLAPRSPYAASKAAAEMAARAAVHAYAIPCVIARSFNHIGVGQDARFVTPSLARQIAEAERRGTRCRLEVGDLTPIRDFSRVDDAAACYRLLLERGEPGEVYNVGCGRGEPVRALLTTLVAAARTEVEIIEDPRRLRAGEPPRLVASTDKLIATIGCAPRPALPDAVLEVLAAARTAASRRREDGDARQGRAGETAAGD